MRGRGVNSQPAPLGKFLDVGIAAGPAAQTGLADAAERGQRLVLRGGVVHVHHPGPQPPGDAHAAGLPPLLGCHATVLRVSSGHRWQALSRFLRNVHDGPVYAQEAGGEAALDFTKALLSEDRRVQRHAVRVVAKMGAAARDVIPVLYEVADDLRQSKARGTFCVLS